MIIDLYYHPETESFYHSVEFSNCGNKEFLHYNSRILRRAIMKFDPNFKHWGSVSQIKLKLKAVSVGQFLNWEANPLREDYNKWAYFGIAKFNDGAAVIREKGDTYFEEEGVSLDFWNLTDTILTSERKPRYFCVQTSYPISGGLLSFNLFAAQVQAIVYGILRFGEAIELKTQTAA